MPRSDRSPVTSTGPAGRLLLSYPDAPWLPDGGRAEVVLAKPGAGPPEPVCLVRLLATHERKILVVPRADGRGLDLPFMRVDGRPVDACVRSLTVDTFGAAEPARLLGFVRNVVHDAPDTYPWPTPYAHFVVWHCHRAMDTTEQGVWLDEAEAECALATRHWWPLAAYALNGLSASPTS